VCEYINNGFKVGPNYCPPATPIADEWMEASDAAVDTSRTEDACWWRTFNDPVLNSLVDTAYGQNLSLRVAGLRILEARALRAIAAGELFPQSQQAFGDYTRSGLSKSSLSGAYVPTRFSSEWDLGTGLSWELDFWGRFRRGIEAADAHLDASVENYDHVLVLLIAEVARSYTDIRIAEQRLAYARRNVEIQRGSLRIAEARLREGVTTRLDVTQATSDLANTEAAIPALESSRQVAMNQLCVLLGMPPQNLDSMLAEAHGIPKTPARVAIGIPAELLRRRPDIRKAERDVAAQSALIGVATSDLYPHFSIDGTIYFDATEFTDLFKADSIAGSVGPSFRWNILNYGRLVNNIRVQESRFQQLAVEYQNTVLRANAEVENALIRFLKSEQRVHALEQSTTAAGQSVDLVQSQYREGVVDFNWVFNAQQFLTQQQDQLAVAEGSVAQNLIQLYAALGGGWQIRFEGVNVERLPVVEPPPEAVLAPDPTIPPQPIPPQPIPARPAPGP
jgi:NodT family efflux transporter outer membrane factor (OMF) lipoprotein